jgi:hypothetical protein
MTMDAEADEIRKRVELRAEFRTRADQPRDPAIHRIEDGGDNGGGNGAFPVAVHRQRNRGRAGGKRRQGDRARNVARDRNGLAEVRYPLHVGLGHFGQFRHQLRNDARIVSPARTVCPAFAVTLTSPGK